MIWDSITAALEALVVRGKVISAVVSGRTLLQVSGLDKDVFNDVELLLPPGYVAVPAPKSDITILQVGAFGSHKIIIGGDSMLDAVANLQPGECGLSRAGQLILLKIGRSEIVSPLLQWGLTEQGLVRLITETATTVFNMHTHNLPGGGATDGPNQQMGPDNLTGGS
jgi:phage gp45-like